MAENEKATIDSSLLEAPIEAAREQIERRRVIRQFTGWIQYMAQRQLRNQQADLRRELQSSEEKTLAYRSMAQYAIGRSIARDATRHIARTRHLANAWRMMRGPLMFSRRWW